jgi:hypothetical protein
MIMPSPNITESLSLTHAITPAAPGVPSSPKTVSMAAAKIQQNGSGVESGIQTVTATAAPIALGALTGATLGRFAIKNLDGANNLSILPAVAGVAFLTLLPGEMAQGRFDPGVTAPAVVSTATVLMEYIVCEA